MDMIQHMVAYIEGALPITFGILKTVANAFSCKLTPTANIKNPSPGAKKLGVNQAKDAGWTLHAAIIKSVGVRIRLQWQSGKDKQHTWLTEPEVR